MTTSEIATIDVKAVQFRRGGNGSLDVLSVHGSPDTRGHGADEVDPFDTPTEIVAFGADARKLRERIGAVVRDHDAAGKTDDRGHTRIDPNAGIRLRARGEIKENDRFVIPHKWLHVRGVDEAEIDVARAEVPDRQAAFRAEIRRAVEIATEHLSDVHKSSEGALDVGWTWPNIFDDDQRPRAYVSLFCYVLGDGRTHLWHGDTLEEAMRLASNDIRLWLRQDGLVNPDAVLDEGAAPVVQDPEDEIEPDGEDRTPNIDPSVPA